MSFVPEDNPILPDGLRIKKSKIHGQGLFTKLPIKSGERLGTGYVIHNNRKFRLALGSFVNHSDTPNMLILEREDGDYLLRDLYTSRPIEEGEELTVNYEEYP